ncbi:MAG: tRNA (adenosine(37)-N6)-threonylcarbamoyltransferase complex dimerization subunit type 1 TsaB [Clostridiaceae bacterium]
MKILSVDSSTSAATVAVLNDDLVLGEVTFNYKKQHSVILMNIIDYLLKGINLTIKDIDGFVVSKGPGSFTGLRIGMATIKGLAQGGNKPYISLSSLDAMAYKVFSTNSVICPLMDALRGNVYTAFYSIENNNLKRISDYMCISIDEVIEMSKDYNTNIIFVGDDVKTFKEKLSVLENVSFAPSHLNHVSAASLGVLGSAKLNLGFSDDVFSDSPLYLRKSQAERELELKKQNG